jgi:hypothetical protein
VYHAQHGAYATTVAQLRQVGFEEPAERDAQGDIVEGSDILKHYTWGGDASIGDGVCLAAYPTTATHNGREIDFATGDIDDC